MLLLRRTGLWTAAAFLLVAGLTAAGLAVSPRLAPAEGRRYAAAPAQRAGYYGVSPAPVSGATQRIKREGTDYLVHYSFKASGRKLDLDAKMPAKVVEESLADFGFAEAELDAIDRWYMKAQKDVIAAANGAGRSAKKELDDLARKYKRRRLDFLAARAWRLDDQGAFAVDVAALVKRSRPRMRETAALLAYAAQAHGIPGDATADAALAFVQTALEYRIPPQEWKGRIIGGVLPPPQALVEGWADCDTKTALLASLLANFEDADIVGMQIPGHYLMAIAGVPQRGDAYLEFEGELYRLVEPTGPARLEVGRVGEQTAQFLQSGEHFTIDRLWPQDG